MASSCLSNDNHNFECITVASVDLIKLPLRDILSSRIKPGDLYHKIQLCSTLHLRRDQQKICLIPPPGVPDYNQFDVTLLYTLIRNLCSLPCPAQGWGNEPKANDTKISDDIERLRLIRNTYYAHATSASISESEFKDIWRNLRSAISRIQCICNVNYEDELTRIEQSKYTYSHLKECKLILTALSYDRGRYASSYGRDEPHITIHGDNEISFGDTARFEADVKNVEFSSWSIIWRKRNKDVMKDIIPNKEKYSGSTKRKLVINSVSKEDQGDYQAVLSVELNGPEYKSRNTITLFVIGEIPFLNISEVKTSSGGIIIQYNCGVVEQSPKVEHIEWFKDGEHLDRDRQKYVGGGVHDSCFTIMLPTYEDRGTYSCKVINAVGSASKDILLGVPRVEISVESPVFVGSETTIKSSILSTPTPDKIEWQRSKDGINFHCIKNANSIKDRSIPACPFYKISKATFEDKLYYRLLVWNGIGKSASNIVQLNVTGSLPNITTSLETNVKDRSVKLMSNVLIYDDSPDILECYWTKNEEKIHVDTTENPSLTIRNVSPCDAGEYQLTAINAVGSSTSDVINLAIPSVFVNNIEYMNNGDQRITVMIKSSPAPCLVQWSAKSIEGDIFTPIDINAEEYKGTTVSFPQPVLVVRQTDQPDKKYRIDVTNFIGKIMHEISRMSYHQPTITVPPSGHLTALPPFVSIQPSPNPNTVNIPQLCSMNHLNTMTPTYRAPSHVPYPFSNRHSRPSTERPESRFPTFIEQKIEEVLQGSKTVSCSAYSRTVPDVSEDSVTMNPEYNLQDVVRCHLCDTPMPTLHCNTCDKHLCTDCKKDHLSCVTKKHEMVSFDRWKRTKSFTKCLKHSLTYNKYCISCDIPICVYCEFSKEHQNHTFVDMLEKLKYQKFSIQRDLQELENSIYPKYREIVSYNLIQKAELCENSKKLITNIIKHGDDMHKEIDTPIMKLKSDLKEIDSKHQDVLIKENDDIEHSISEITKTIADLKKLLDSNDINLVTSFKSRNAEFRRLPPKLTVFLPRFFPQRINKDQIHQQVGSLSESYVKKEERGSTIDYQSYWYISSERPLIDVPQILTSNINTDYGHLLCSVSCLNDENIWTCGFNDNMMKLYNLQGKLEKKIKTKSMKNPSDSAVTQNGELVYIDPNDRSVNILKNTQIQTLIRLHEWVPCSVCSTISGDLLVAMYCSFDKQTKVVCYSGSTEKKSIQFNDNGEPLYSPKGYKKNICENRNLDICVSDYKANAVVVVNQAGKLRFTYTGHRNDLSRFTKRSFTPHGITTDSQSRILTSDKNNNCIHILDQDGQFLRFIDNCDLQWPSSLCVDTKDSLFVAELSTGEVKKIQYCTQIR